MIKSTRQHGAENGRARFELGEWSPTNRAAERVLVTPGRPGALIPGVESERGLAVILAWLHPLSHARNAVQFLTTPAGD